MRTYFSIFFSFVFCICTSQTYIEDIKSKTLGFSNNPKEVNINNSTIYVFDENGFLIKKTMKSSDGLFVIVNKISDKLLKETRTFENEILINLENYYYDHHSNIVRYESITNNDTLIKTFDYKQNKLEKINEKIGNDNIVRNHYYSKDVDSIVSYLSQDFLEKAIYTKNDTLVISKFYESNLIKPDTEIKTYYKDGKIFKEEYFSFGSLFQKTLYFEHKHFKLKNMDKNEVGLIIVNDERNNWIKKIQNNVIIEERIIEYDDFFNFKKVMCYKNNILTENYDYNYVFHKR